MVSFRKPPIRCDGQLHIVECKGLFAANLMNNALRRLSSIFYSLGTAQVNIELSAKAS